MLSISRIYSSAILGVDAYLVEVEVDISLGLPQFSTVGLPEGAVRESKERVKSAIKNCGYNFPNRKITVNLAPADIRKEGSAFDLPITVGILVATELIKNDGIGNYLILGELSLDGRVNKIKGALPCAILARDMGLSGIILPRDNAKEAAVVNGIEVLGIQSLGELVEMFSEFGELIKEQNTVIGQAYLPRFWYCPPTYETRITDCMVWAPERSCCNNR